MKILFASAEVKPFSKVGGLADVVGSLPKYLEKDAEIAIFTPLYGCIDKEKFNLKKVENSKLHMQFGWSENFFELYMAKLPDTNINVFFIDNPKYFGCFNCVYPFNLDERYNHERFIAFSKTTLEYARRLNFKPDVIQVMFSTCFPAVINTHSIFNKFCPFFFIFEHIDCVFNTV